MIAQSAAAARITRLTIRAAPGYAQNIFPPEPSLMRDAEYRNILTSQGLTRRGVLRLGGAAGLTLGMLPFLRAAKERDSAANSTAPGFGRAKSVLLVYASGGQSQLDMWDMKPHAPAEVRGDFRPIATAVPGTTICEHMPRLARLADRYTLLRSVSHDDLDHGSATYLALTGRPHAKKSSNPPASPNDYPTFGSVLHRVRPAKHLPYTAVHVNGPALVPEYVAPGQNAGFLGRACEPLLIGDPTEEPIPLRGLDAPPDVTEPRLAGRHALLKSLDDDAGPERPLREMEQSYRQAFDLLAAKNVRDAFDLSREPAALRERYGAHRSGQSCLLARRLVEAGVPWVTVIWNHSNRGQDKHADDTDWYGWDTHNDIFDALKVHLLPRFDRSFSALLEDLDQRGLLDSTLVVCMGEFGRAPLVALERTFDGTSPGRKHWAGVYSIVLAGAGVARGGVVGASDRDGAYPSTGPVGPWDVAATMFHALGVAPDGHATDPSDKPFAITTGKPVTALYG
jgi:hypothetical protein